jgi:hypothetical protein
VPYRISIWNSWKAILNQLTLKTVDNPIVQDTQLEKIKKRL